MSEPFAPIMKNPSVVLPKMGWNIQKGDSFSLASIIVELWDFPYWEDAWKESKYYRVLFENDDDCRHIFVATSKEAADIYHSIFQSTSSSELDNFGLEKW